MTTKNAKQTHTQEQECGCEIDGAKRVDLYLCTLHAAAPDLLAALKLSADYLRNHCFRTGTGTKEDRAFEAATAAIQKAEGK